MNDEASKETPMNDAASILAAAYSCFPSLRDMHKILEIAIEEDTKNSGTKVKMSVVRSLEVQSLLANSMKEEEDSKNWMTNRFFDFYGREFVLFFYATDGSIMRSDSMDLMQFLSGQSWDDYLHLTGRELFPLSDVLLLGIARETPPRFYKQWSVKPDDLSMSRLFNNFGQIPIAVGILPFIDGGDFEVGDKKDTR